MIKILAFFILFFLIPKSFSQEKIQFEKLEFGKVDIQSIVYATTYDKYGNLWLATEEGALRCNSNSIYTYNTSKGIPEEIGNRVFCIFKDLTNNIWIGTERGIAKFDYKKNKFSSISLEGFEVDKINQIGQFSKNEIFFCSNKGLWKIQDDKILPVIKNEFIYNFLIDNDKVIYVSSQGIYSVSLKNLSKSKIDLAPYSNDVVFGAIIKKIGPSIFIATKNGRLYRTDESFSFVQQINFAISQKGITIRDIEYKDNKYFLALDGEGIVVLNENYQLLSQYKHNENDFSSISSNGVYDLYFGNDGINWYATYGGGVCYSVKNKDNFKIVKHQVNSENSLANNTTRAIAENGNSIWFGTKKGISIYNKESNNWKHILSLQNTKSSVGNIVLCLEKQGNNIWAGTYNQGVYKINTKTFEMEHFSTNASGKNQIFVDKVFVVFNDNKGDVWIGGVDGYLTVIRKNQTTQKINIKNIRAISQRDDGKIIVAGKDGVFLIDNNYLISKIEELKPNSKKLNYNTINAINALPNYLMMATNGNGLILYHWKSKKVSVIDKNYNLPSSIIQGLIPLSEKEIWVSTTKGLANIKFNATDTIVKNFSKVDGLSSNEFNYGSFFKDSQGLIYFGGVNGVTVFNPKQLKTRNIFPKIVIEEFKIDNKTIENETDLLPDYINETNQLNLSHNQNSFGFKIAGILHGYSSKVNYTYKLDGFDQNWSPLTSNNEINYTNISPGNYVLKIKATNEFGEFGKERQVIIEIASPWYATIWAYIIYFLLLGFVIYTIVNVTKIMEIKKSKEEQINFFNNLTHEIKTPLSILLNSLDEQHITDVASKERVKSTIKRIDSLVNQMLSFQRYTNYDDQDILVKKLHVYDYIHKIITDFKPLLELKNLEVEIENNYKQEIFYFDEEQLNKIVFNLTSNAIKYSHDNGKIIIKIDDALNGNLKLSVQDFGIGIPKAEQNNILNKFFRAKNAVKNQISGTGLGLLIVKSIIDATGGKINIISEENVGSIFNIELKSLSDKYIESAVADMSENLLDKNTDILAYQNYKILIVEDNTELRNYLKNTLEHYFLVYEAKNGKEGFDMAQSVYPDLILTDFMMPVMDGLEMCLKIKENINLNHIPVFMLTALQDSVHKKETLEQGITEYIEKPINIAILLAKITNTFNWQEKLKEKYMHLGEMDVAEKNKNQNENDFIEKLEKIILEKIKDENFSLQDICTVLGMSRTSLYMKLKSLIDLSPQDFIILTKLKHAKKILIKGDVNIKEVAYACGFSNPKYFSTSFKKTYGITPTEFIKSLEK